MAGAAPIQGGYEGYGNVSGNVPIGAMTLHKILYLYPSFANVSVNPTCESLAACEVSDTPLIMTSEKGSPE